MNVCEAVAKRFSARAFRPEPVSGELVRAILDEARQTPSGGNLQPWRVYALGTHALSAFKREVADQMARGITETPEYSVYPARLWEPLRTRRREAGALRYAALGVAEKDADGQLELSRRNYAFFGAPTGLLFCIDRRCGPPQWSDLGMYMLSVMLLAAERGLDTCAQESWSNWPVTVSRFLELPAELMLFAGMALGYRDEASPLNAARTTRAALAEFAVFKGI
jgi:nitroreductase